MFNSSFLIQLHQTRGTSFAPMIRVHFSTAQLQIHDEIRRMPRSTQLPPSFTRVVQWTIVQLICLFLLFTGTLFQFWHHPQHRQTCIQCAWLWFFQSHLYITPLRPFDVKTIHVNATFRFFIKISVICSRKKNQKESKTQTNDNESVKTTHASNHRPPPPTQPLTLCTWKGGIFKFNMINGMMVLTAIILQGTGHDSMGKEKTRQPQRIGCFPSCNPSVKKIQSCF